MSSISRTSAPRKRLLKPAAPSLRTRADELAGEGLDGRVAHGQAVAVARDVVADRVQQVRLAEPGRAVQEERVVGLAGQLGDGERRGVREAVAVADDELLERVLRVQADASRRPSCARLGLGRGRRRLPVLADQLDVDPAPRRPRAAAARSRSP